MIYAVITSRIDSLNRRKTLSKSLASARLLFCGKGDGSAIRSLKHPDAETIPIVAMTANAFEEDRKKAFEKGMNGHIAKPVDAEKVKKTILSAIR